MRRSTKRRWRVPESMMVSLAVLCMAGGLLAQSRPATQPATAPAQEAKAAGMSFLQLLMSGGWFMVPIGVTSLIGLALIMERSLALRQSKIAPRGFMQGLRAAGSDPAKAMQYCRAQANPMARVMLAGLRKLPHGSASVEKAMEDAGGNEIHRLRRNLRLLYGVSAVAPMLGLLGTVWGMIEAFRVTAAHHGLGKPELLATGIYQALVTTLAGLMVAIPVLMFYYYFTGKIEQAVAELNDASGEFMEQFVEEKKEVDA